MQKSMRVVERQEKKKNGINTYGDMEMGGCMEDESERPSLLLEAVMGMI